MTFLLLARRASDLGVLISDGFAGDRLCWSHSQLLDAGFVVVLRLEASCWLDARAQLI